MMPRRQFLSALTTTVLLALPLVAQAAKGKATNRAEGTITAVDSARMTVTIRGVTYQVNSTTKIERNGLHATLSRVRVGDAGQVTFVVGSTGLVAQKLEAVGPK